MHGHSSFLTQDEISTNDFEIELHYTRGSVVKGRKRKQIKKRLSLLRLLDGGFHTQQHEPERNSHQRQAAHNWNDAKNLGRHIASRRGSSASGSSGTLVAPRPDRSEGLLRALRHTEVGHLALRLQTPERLQAPHAHGRSGVRPLGRRRLCERRHHRRSACRPHCGCRCHFCTWVWVLAISQKCDAEQIDETRLSARRVRVQRGVKRSEG